ncbi:MAG: alpha/beta fold hydrolase [Caulobacteraceae bacterium]
MDLVLAPGMLSDEAVWAPQAAALASEANLHIARYGQARTLAAMAEALLDQAPARFALAGHSMGARVAMEAARIAPGRLTGLCLISADPLPKPAGKVGEAETRSRYDLLELGRSRGMEAVAERFLPVLIHRDRLADVALTGSIRAMIIRQDTDALERQIQAGEGRPDHEAALRAVEVPSLLICGAEDGFGRAPLQSAMASLMANARVLLVDDCGHLPMLEAPLSVIRAMHDWLATTTARSRAPHPQDAL